MIVYQKLLNQIYKLHVHLHISSWSICSVYQNIDSVTPLEVRIGNSNIPKAFILCLSDLPTPTVFLWEEVATLVIVFGMNNFSLLLIAMEPHHPVIRSYKIRIFLWHIINSINLNLMNRRISWIEGFNSHFCHSPLPLPLGIFVILVRISGSCIT